MNRHCPGSNFHIARPEMLDKFSRSDTITPTDDVWGKLNAGREYRSPYLLFACGVFVTQLQHTPQLVQSLFTAGFEQIWLVGTVVLQEAAPMEIADGQ